MAFEEDADVWMKLLDDPSAAGKGVPPKSP
jgi:hypothetical protein